jgi:hypothetical protein
MRGGVPKAITVGLGSEVVRETAFECIRRGASTRALFQRLFKWIPLWIEIQAFPS